nr:hypothetical protein [Tanacetum cinerariifolium]
MSSFNQRECLGCGQPYDGYHCYSCTCQQCGVILLNGICINCTYGDGKPVTCCVCEGPLRGGFCLFCDSKAENSFTYNPNAYSFNDTSSNFNHLPQPQFETYLCKLCGNNSHYGYDCPPQFSFVYKQESSYNQNYNDKYYPHNLLSFLSCDNYEESHETFQCQPMDQNTDSSGFDQIQTPQYPVIHHPSQEMSEEVFHAKGNLMNDDESLSDNEDVPMEDFKVSSNPLFDDEEIKSDKIYPHYFNAEFDFVESLSTHDTLFDSSPKFDYLEEFSAINSFSLLMENLHANTIVETLPTSSILIEDNDSLREEIDIFTGTDDLLPPSIESDDYDSKGDIHFLEELLGNDTLPILENESSDFDHHDDLSFPRLPPKPPDVEFFFDFEPNSGEVISVVMNNIDELNEDECFDP